MTELQSELLTSRKYEDINRSATELFDSDPHWSTYFREILGVDGIIRRLFITHDSQSHGELQTFYQSALYRHLCSQLNKLRSKKERIDTEEEPTRVITVRLPKSLHTWLVDESHLYRTSMNKLAITKLLQPLTIEPVDPFIRNTVPFKSQTA